MKISLLGIFFIFLSLTGCQKRISDEFPGTATVRVDQSALRISVNNWLDEQQRKHPEASSFIDTLRNSIQWGAVNTTTTTNESYYALYCPIAYNDNATSLVFTLERKDFSVQSGYIAEFRFQNTSHEGEKEILAKLYNNQPPRFSGSITAYSITKKFVIETGYKDGKRTFYRKQEKQAPSGGSVKIDGVRNANDLPKKLNDCTVYYLNTYWDDGSIDTEYLGMVCDDGGGVPCEVTKVISRGSGVVVSTNCAASGGGTVSEIDFTNVVVYTAPKPITNVSQYIKCFTAGGTNCKVAVYVDQPVPNTNTIFSGTNVGHTFLTFTQTLSNGQVVTRNVGFYPGPGGVKGSPVAPSCAGALNNDDDHTWNTGVEYSVTGDNFMKILNYMTSSTNTATYNLNTNNCTSMALGALQQGGITINAPTGYVNVVGTTVFSGYNPAMLGETIRTMDLGTNMARLHPPTDSSPKASHPNTGDCQ